MTGETSQSKLFGDDHLHQPEPQSVTDSPGTTASAGSETRPETDSGGREANVATGKNPGPSHCSCWACWYLDINPVVCGCDRCATSRAVAR